jgi:hypothetical protein
MNRVDHRLFWGLLLLGGGILFLLQNLGIFELSNPVLAILLGCAGLIFLSVVIADRKNWWGVIPGLILIYIATLIVLDRLFPAFSNDYGGAFFLGIIGISFWIIFLLNQANWWAIIPGGVMLSLAAVTALGRSFSGIQTGGVLFIGLGLTFGLLALYHTPQGRMRWPLIPASVLLLIGMLIIAASSSIFRLIWPVAIILIGIYLFMRRNPAR